MRLTAVMPGVIIDKIKKYAKKIKGIKGNDS